MAITTEEQAMALLKNVREFNTEGSGEQSKTGEDNARAAQPATPVPVAAQGTVTAPAAPLPAERNDTGAGVLAVRGSDAQALLKDDQKKFDMAAERARSDEDEIRAENERLQQLVSQAPEFFAHDEFEGRKFEWMRRARLISPTDMSFGGEKIKTLPHAPCMPNRSLLDGLGVLNSTDKEGVLSPDEVREVACRVTGTPAMESDQPTWRIRRSVLPLTIDALVKKEEGFPPHVSYYMRESSGIPIFRDYGDKMKLAGGTSDMAIIAMLDAADRKYGRFEVFGDDAFKQRAAKLAGKYGFGITNPELADIVREAANLEPVSNSAPAMAA